jgi:hypothetical protein
LDHAAFDPKTRRVFIAHTARNTVKVIDHDAGRHETTLPGFRMAARRNPRIPEKEGRRTPSWRTRATGFGFAIDRQAQGGWRPDDR